jgi:murein peptide amidase A
MRRLRCPTWFGGPVTSTSLVSLLAAACLAVPTAVLSSPAAAGGHRPSVAPAREAPAVIGSRRIGRSVKGREIRAYRLGDRDARVKAVVLGSMHGDERAGIKVANALRFGRPVRGVDLWVVPTMNPDGVARGTRGNARGVDLNRNFGHQWARLGGRYYSGPRRWSEPESRALRRFLDDVRPRFVVSFHQPLHGVGRSATGKPFQRRLARGLGLPIKAFNCTGRCSGTMTSWHNARHRGTAITVEFGSSPTRRYLRGKAARGTLRAVLGRRAGPAGS